jgi:hypothetical protein
VRKKELTIRDLLKKAHAMGSEQYREERKNCLAGSHQGRESQTKKAGSCFPPAKIFHYFFAVFFAAVFFFVAFFAPHFDPHATVNHPLSNQFFLHTSPCLSLN